MKRIVLYISCCFVISASAQTNSFYKEKYRPQFHFTPAIHWMNDPNGLIYYAGEYHLFYQFNPFGFKWGHMSWGHAVSNDLLHWQHLPLAIPEEKDTMIFSGACVVDKNNTSGFAVKGRPGPMVAVYTGHIEGSKQSQHLAYSIDSGRSWTKYNHNPVLDLGKKDFRDPAVFWYQPEEKWVMAAAWPVERQIHFYSSKNLKQWEETGYFGPAGDTAGIWECPDLFQVPIEDEPGKTKWVLMLSPAPYMQYFVGTFDGASFKNENLQTKVYRPDYGSDYYAAIAYRDMPEGKLPTSIGWINNWEYANNIPTSPWKSAMSLPRQLSLKKIQGEWVLLQKPVEQIKKLRSTMSSWKNVDVANHFSLPLHSQTFEMEIIFTPTPGGTGGIRVAKGMDHYFEIGYDLEKKLIYIDRTKAGDSSFHPQFARLNRYETSLLPIDGKIMLHLFFDKSIVEVFANRGEAVLTAQIFPDDQDNGIELFTTGGKLRFDSVKYWPVKSVWMQ